MFKKMFYNLDKWAASIWFHILSFGGLVGVVISRCSLWFQIERVNSPCVMLALNILGLYISSDGIIPLCEAGCEGHNGWIDRQQVMDAPPLHIFHFIIQIFGITHLNVLIIGCWTKITDGQNSLAGGSSQVRGHPSITIQPHSSGQEMNAKASVSSGQLYCSCHQRLMNQRSSTSPGPRTPTWWRRRETLLRLLYMKPSLQWQTGTSCWSFNHTCGRSNESLHSFSVD